MALVRLVGPAALAIAFAAPVLHAQVSTALVQGEITDETKAVLPGATVTARNEETGFARTAISDARGYYRIIALPPGTYKITAELTGFATVDKTSIPLTIGQEAAINFQLQLVTVQESITVTGESPLVEVSKTTLGTTINAKKLEELPMAGRNYLSLLTLAAGVTSQGGAGGMASAGRNSGRTGYVVDGVSQERNVFPSARGSLSPDSVQEFQILTNMFSAEYGQASGPIVNILTRSGTNALHGRVGAFTRLNELDARDYFATGEAPYSQQWYSANVGGPIIRDKAHYFGAFEGIKTDQTAVVTSPLAPGEFPTTFRQTKTLVKGDYQIGSAHHFSGRFNRDWNANDNNGVGGLNTIERAQTADRSMWDAQVTANSILGPQWLNELRVQYARDYNTIEGKCTTCPALARPSGNFGKATNMPQWWDERRLQFVDYLSWTGGVHHLKFGVNYSHIWTDVFFPNTRDGSFRFETDLPFNAADPRTYPVQYRHHLRRSADGHPGQAAVALRTGQLAGLVALHRERGAAIRLAGSARGVRRQEQLRPPVVGHLGSQRRRLVHHSGGRRRVLRPEPAGAGALRAAVGAQLHADPDPQPRLSRSVRAQPERLRLGLSPDADEDGDRAGQADHDELSIVVGGRQGAHRHNASVVRLRVRARHQSAPQSRHQLCGSGDRPAS